MVSQERGTGRSRTSTSSARGRLAHATPSSWRSREDSGTAESFITQHTLSQGAPIRGQGFTPQTTGLLAMLSLFYRHTSPPHGAIAAPFAPLHEHERKHGHLCTVVLLESACFAEPRFSVRHGTPLGSRARAARAAHARSPSPARPLGSLMHQWRPRPSLRARRSTAAARAHPRARARRASASLGARLSDDAHSGPHDR